MIRSMLRRLVPTFCLLACAASAQVPEGFTPIFNHQNLAGWHISLTNHHGDTSEWRIRDGVLTATQRPKDVGGILLTDDVYSDFEVYLEIKPDFGCDGGLFLRSNAAGQAYQVTLDYVEGGEIGMIYGERLQGVETTPAEKWESVWKKDEWNSIRARIEGDIPHIQVWMNGEKVNDFTDTANHAVNEATKGMIAVQVHGGSRCEPGKFQRFRNIAVKRLD